MDYKIAVRSYKRSKTILKKTLGELYKQADLDLKNQLYIAVTEEDLPDYEDSLRGYPFKQFIIADPGGFQATNSILDHFPAGERIIFMDDDISGIKEYKDIQDSSSRADAHNLGRYFDYAFRKFGDVPFGFDFTPNLMFKQGKPFAEMKMRKIGGAWWGAVNDPKLLRTAQSHEDDNIRTAAALEKYGKVGSINWLVAATAVGLNEGGMQSSGDRDVTDIGRHDKTLAACYHAIVTGSVAKFYQSEPAFIDSMNFYSLRLKNIRNLRKENPLNTECAWSGYFQEVPDQNDSNTLEDFFDAT